MFVAAVDLDDHAFFGEPLLAGEYEKRVKDNVNALVVDELPKKAETIDRAGVLAAVEAWRRD